MAHAEALRFRWRCDLDQEGLMQTSSLAEMNLLPLAWRSIHIHSEILIPAHALFFARLQLDSAPKEAS